MIPVWLHEADGRPFLQVYVQMPVPLAVTYAGRMFVWTAPPGEYRAQNSPVVPTAHAFAATQKVDTGDQ